MSKLHGSMGSSNIPVQRIIQEWFDEHLGEKMLMNQPEQSPISSLLNTFEMNVDNMSTKRNAKHHCLKSASTQTDATRDSTGFLLNHCYNVWQLLSGLKMAQCSTEFFSGRRVYIWLFSSLRRWHTRVLFENMCMRFLTPDWNGLASGQIQRLYP